MTMHVGVGVRPIRMNGSAFPLIVAMRYQELGLQLITNTRKASAIDHAWAMQP